MVCSVAAVTLKTAETLVTAPASLVTVTVKIAPLSAITVEVE